MNGKTEAGRRGTEKTDPTFSSQPFRCCPLPRAPSFPEQRPDGGDRTGGAGVGWRGAEGRTARSEVKEEQRRGEKEKIYLWAAAEGRRSRSSRRQSRAAAGRRSRSSSKRSEAAEMQAGDGSNWRSGGQRLRSSSRTLESAEEGAAGRAPPESRCRRRPLLSPLSSLFWRAAGLGAPARGYRRRDFPRGGKSRVISCHSRDL